MEAVPENGQHKVEKGIRVVSGSDIVWHQKGSSFSVGTTAQQTSRIPPGIYVYESNNLGWWLERTASHYEFGYKVYGCHDGILSRATRAWAGVGRLGGNLGILFNGLKGTGKTVTAQKMANLAVKEGLPVLAVSSPIPLGDVLGKLNQPAMVIFDEFEKTHEKTSEGDPQQEILSAIDGMARNGFPRLFLFISNDPKLNENFVDRPSRIRYCYEFGRLEDNVLEEILTDRLDPDLHAMRPAILQYLATRHVLSIDVAKTVIDEVNLFREPPSEFAHILNLSELEAKTFTVQLLDSSGTPYRTLASYFTPPSNVAKILRNGLTRGGRDEFVRLVGMHHGSYRAQDRVEEIAISFLEPYEKDPKEWVCQVSIPAEATWLRSFKEARSRLMDPSLWIDEKPRGWTIPSWAEAMREGRDLTEEEKAAWNTFDDAASVYGGEATELLVRVTPNYERESEKITYKIADF